MSLQKLNQNGKSSEPSSPIIDGKPPTGQSFSVAKSEPDLCSNSGRLQSTLPRQISSLPGSHSLLDICMEEVAPEHTHLIDSDAPIWKTHPIDMFRAKFRGKHPDDRSLPKRVRRYYKKQDALIDTFTSLNAEMGSTEWLDIEVRTSISRVDNILAKVTLLTNLVLLIGKCVATGLSGSLSIISSLLDSCVDLVSGLIMWLTMRAMRKPNLYHYPQGRTRLEPVAIIVLAVVMSVCSIQIIREAIQIIVAMATAGKKAPNVDNATIAITCGVVVAKVILWIVCAKLGNTAGSEALAQDNRNDVLSNSIALVCSALSSRLPEENLKYMDPIGAILIGIYIVFSWFRTGWEHAKALTGHSARPEFLQQLTFIALNHHPRVDRIDTVRAFHFGSNFLVEVDIVVPADMTIREAHDIGESLQKKLERMGSVERAFVHLDYEWSHDPRSEHKQV